MIKDIKKETLKKIATAAINCYEVSRGDLAIITGLTSMTLGKAIPILVERKLFAEKRAPISKGRHASLLCPSVHIVNVATFISSAHTEVFAESLSGAEVIHISRPYNHSLTTSENVTLAMRELFGKAELENRIAMRALVILSETKDFNGFDIDLASDMTFMAEKIYADGASVLLPDGNVLCVRVLEDTLSPLVISNKNVFLKDGAKDIHVGTTSDRAHNIARLISALSEYTKIHNVIIEGSTSSENELVFMVNDVLVGEYSFKKKDLPHITYYGNFSFMRKALFRKLREKYVCDVCDALFVEEELCKIYLH